MQEMRVWSEEWNAPHSSILAEKIPRTKEPGRLQSLESGRVRHNWATKHIRNLKARKYGLLELEATLEIVYF